MPLLLLGIAPFVLAALVGPASGRLPKHVLTWGLTAITAALFVGFLGYVPEVSTGAAATYVLEWVPALNLSLSVYVDSLALLFTLLVTGIGALIALYTGHYFDETPDVRRFYQLLFIFMGGMLVLVMSGNLFTLFIGWETTSISSFFLISFKGKAEAARRGAMQALVITAGGGLALLLGLALLGTAAGSFELSAILGQKLQDHPFYTAIAILIFIGCFTKSAQWPFHFWLPGAMTAPTPASAYLHSATMVKAGVYLLFRMYPVLGDTPLWSGTLLTIGLITMGVGAFVALRHTDLKLILAFSTVSQLGAFVALISLPGGKGLLPTLVGVLAHAMYKGALFLIAGTVDHSTGTRELPKLGGLAHHMRPLAVAAVLAGLSMAGLPPLLGFLAKEKLLEVMLTGASPLALVVVVVSALFTVTVITILVWEVFFRRAPTPAADHQEEGHHFHAPSWGLQASPAVLAILSLMTGLLLNPLVDPLVAPYLTKGPLQLWAGINTPFLLSVVAVVGGLGVFAVRGVWRRIPLPKVPQAKQVYDAAIRGVEGVADVLLTSQNGKIRYYLAAILAAVILLMSTAGLTRVQFSPQAIQLSSGSDVLEAALLGLTVGATFASILFRRHLLAAIALGVTGYSVGGLFLLEPAPDVALVQFLVETIGTVLVIIMLSRISAPERKQVIDNLWNQTRPGLIRDILISALVGVGVGLFSLAAVLNRPTRDTIAEWHLENSKQAVDAADVVAAILTDFRGTDTVVEIMVFGMAALGILTLLSTPEPGRALQFRAGQLLQRLRARGVNPAAPTAAEKKATQDIQQVIEQEPDIKQAMDAMLAEEGRGILATPLTRVVATLMLPVSLLIAIAHIAYGANAPGDGFTAGVVGGLGVAVWYVVFGYDETKRRLRWLHPVPLIGAGLGLAILNAVVPLLFGEVFLRHTGLKDVTLPAGLHLSSTTFFEVAIFLTVLGSTALILETIAHPQEVETI